MNLLASDLYVSGVEADAEYARTKATRYAFETLEYLANCAREAAREPRVAGAPGKVPARDLLRIWDSGASQGMTDMSLVSSDARVKGESVNVSLSPQA